MARYRTKDETDLRWNAIRRAATARVDLEVKTWRERYLNDVLSELWSRYAAGLNEGEVRELDPEYGKWIADALKVKGPADETPAR